MAKNNLQNTTQVTSSSFNKGLNKDADPSFVSEGMWTHARNASNNTLEGDLGVLSNETSNVFCAEAGKTLGPDGYKKYIIGSIYLYSDKWVLFTVAYDATGLGAISKGSEIGLYEEDLCRYRPIVQDTCLNFSKYHLISGASREKEDCSWGIYFADGFNPDRYLNIGDPQTWPSKEFSWVGNNTYANSQGYTMLWPGVQWTQECKDANNIILPGPPNYKPTGCITCTNLTSLDCTETRLARLMKPPCVNVKKSVGAGVLRNGSYSACIAYTIKSQPVTDYFSMSNPQPIYSPDDLQGSIDIEIDADFENFDEFVLVVVETINQQTVAKQVGFYSTKTSLVHIDQLKEDLISVPLNQITVKTPVYEKSDQIIEVNNYLLRVGPTSKFDFNYQPLANLIETEWVSVEYPANYYINGGKNAGYLRDEVYTFFIRWIYNTGDKSPSYHIPGRYPDIYPSLGIREDKPYVSPLNSLEGDTKVFQTINTAQQTSTAVTYLADGGKVIARGKMGYWESTEMYPDNKPEVWNASGHCYSPVTEPSYQYDLCGLPIRHHRFPDNALTPQTNHFVSNNGLYIRILGVDFKNITYPKDNEGRDIPGIIGYEILRGSREGNRSIIAKGMINNLRSYNIKGAAAGQNVIGLYPNHPFNTITTPLMNNYDDPYFLPDTSFTNTIPTNLITFHSPDTNFRTPFLSGSELKLYGSLHGTSTQQFIIPDKHPQFKLMSNAVMIFIFIGGLTEMAIAGVGEMKRQKVPYGAGNGKGDAVGAYATAAAGGAVTQAIAGFAYDNALKLYFTLGGAFLDSFTAGISPLQTSVDLAFDAVVGVTSGLAGIAPSGYGYTRDIPKVSYAGPFAFVNMLQTNLMYFQQGADLISRLIQLIISYRQYALQMIAHGFYDSFTAPDPTKRVRFNTSDSFYLDDSIQDVPEFAVNQRYRINNLKRSKTVVVRTTTNTGANSGPDFITANPDNSLVTVGSLMQSSGGIDFSDQNVRNQFSRTIASHYAGIKFNIENQYGQLNSIKQLPVTPCEQKLEDSNVTEYTSSFSCPNVSQISFKTISDTPVFFGGDTYINRYTEKNSMFMFYDWLYGQPNGFEYNYALRQMIPQPRFWVNSEKYDISYLWQNLIYQISKSQAENMQAGGVTPGTGAWPRDFYTLDFYVSGSRFYNYNSSQSLFNGREDYKGVFSVKEAYFYLSTSAVRDFFVESEVIVDFRQQGLEQGEKVYFPNKYTDLTAMFNMNPEVITKGNFYAYDYSLSATKLFTQFFSQGSLQSPYYDPNVAKLCYTYYPDRILYSLPQQQLAFKDSWFIYLINNYKEFKNQISGVKNFAKTGIFITFKNSSPLVYQGVDTLETDAGTKITIGDGGLFAQTPQSVVVSDDAYEYGSSQNRRSVISTPAGMFYMSQNQGKIFEYVQGLQEISNNGLKWWFNIFMPYKLTEDFPDYPHLDNPVAGIGCQSIYDNQNGILYFCKKDFKLRPDFIGRTVFDTNKNAFIVDGTKKVDIGDSNIFEDASWTVSYDVKSKFFISFHDWHPDIVMPSKNTFLTTKFNKIYFHNNICGSYCNFYGQDYPFEVEVPIATGQQVTTLRSFEYILESYKRASNCFDQFQVLDYNFDRVVVHNAEQVSGYLDLNIFPKNNITLSLQYPKYNAAKNSFDILYTKEENKLRFNQFWDITKDRSEFPVGSDYPPTGAVIPGTTILAGPHIHENIWVTQSNGYIKSLNTNNLDYAKSPLQRKKFRNYLNMIFFRKDFSGDVNMIMKLSNSKSLISFR